ncbi:MAG: hypothetical protein DI628_04410 [Blastochloris viridis]|uniref:PPM-type phosphatase domain-containing protein n=1 Tax=Blastochloris viridis TaxID=1079 RepID=A0A6N4RF23_BLAVI|nr:MAG: hypothetical protein DI628_04410 [Blastochloris viridis]
MPFQPAKPTFTSLNTFCLGKTGEGFGDDRVLSLPGRFDAIFDGVTGPNGSASADLNVHVLRHFPADGTHRQLADAFAEAHRARFGSHTPGQRMAASTGAVLSHHHSQVFLWGDAIAVLVYRDHHVVHVDEASFRWSEPLHFIRALYNRLYLKEHNLSEEVLLTQDFGREMLAPFGNVQHQLANIEGGYSVICAKPVPDSLLKSVEVTPDVEKVFLLSDGYPAKNFGFDDFRSIGTLNEALEQQIMLDPYCLGPDYLEPESFPGNPGPKGLRKTGDRLNFSYDDCAINEILVL